MKYKNKYLALKKLIGSGKKPNCKKCSTSVSSLKQWEKGLCDECLNKKKILGKGLSKVALKAQENYRKIFCPRTKNLDQWNKQECDLTFNKLSEEQAKKYKIHKENLILTEDLKNISELLDV